MTNNQELVVGRVAHSASTEVRVTRVETKEKEKFVDIRTFFLDVNSAGSNFAERILARDADLFKPSKKGVFIRQDVFVELMEKVLIPVLKIVQKEG